MFGLSIKLFWILVALAFGVAEAATLSLTMIWFSIGAIAALVTSYFTDSIFIQLIVFGVVSFVFLIFATRKLIKMDRDKDNRYWGSKDTNTDAVVGKRGFVLKAITPERPGVVKVRGEEWTAISSNEDDIIETGEEIMVEEVQGVKLIVRRK